MKFIIGVSRENECYDLKVGSENMGRIRFDTILKKWIEDLEYLPSELVSMIGKAIEEHQNAG